MPGIPDKETLELIKNIDTVKLLLIALIVLLGVVSTIGMALIRNRRADRRERNDRLKAKQEARRLRSEARRNTQRDAELRQDEREKTLLSLISDSNRVTDKLADAIEANTQQGKDRNAIDVEQDKTLAGHTAAINKVVLKADEGIAKIEANTQTVAGLKASVETAASAQTQKLDDLVAKVPHLSEQMQALSEQLKPYGEEFKAIRKGLNDLLETSQKMADQLKTQIDEMEVQLVKELSKVLTQTPPADTTIASSVPSNSAPMIT
jgi:DNA repair exonuclease SbcCD ATPase subunit